MAVPSHWANLELAEVPWPAPTKARCHVGHGTQAFPDGCVWRNHILNLNCPLLKVSNPGMLLHRNWPQTLVEAAAVLLLQWQYGPMCSAAICFRNIIRGSYSSTPWWYCIFPASDNASHNTQPCSQLWRILPNLYKKRKYINYLIIIS